MVSIIMLFNNRIIIHAVVILYNLLFPVNSASSVRLLILEEAENTLSRAIQYE